MLSIESLELSIGMLSIKRLLTGRPSPVELRNAHSNSLLSSLGRRSLEWLLIGRHLMVTILIYRLLIGRPQVAKNSSEGYYFSCHSPTFQDDPSSCLMNDKRVNTTAIPASYYGCPEAGYCPNKQVSAIQI